MSPQIRIGLAVGGYGVLVALLGVAVWLKTPSPEPPPEPASVLVGEVGGTSRPGEYPGQSDLPPSDSPPSLRTTGRVYYDRGSSVPHYKLDLPLPEIPKVDPPSP